MRKEAAICGKCRIRRSCHTVLQPEIVNDDGKTRPIPDRYTHIPDLDCRHVTCDSEGMPAARRAKKSGKYIQFPIYDRGATTDIRAVPFGSPDKATLRGAWRIVSDAGQIFSKHKNIYYPTGQWI